MAEETSEEKNERLWDLTQQLTKELEQVKLHLTVKEEELLQKEQIMHALTQLYQAKSTLAYSMEELRLLTGRDCIVYTAAVDRAGLAVREAYNTLKTLGIDECGCPRK